MTRPRRVAIAAGAVLVAAVLAGCANLTPPRAAEFADQIADEFGDDITPPVIHAVPADYIVATRVPGLSYEQPSGTLADVEALSWEGDTGTEPGATIELRIHVEDPAGSEGTVFGDSWEASSVTRCYRFQAIGYRFYDNLTMEQFGCPDTPAPPLPTPDFLAAIPDDGDETLTAILRDATAETIEADVRAAFPEPEYTIDTDSSEGRLIVALGLPRQGDCLLALRNADGTIEVGGADQTQIQPGELGCSTQLITSPPL